MIVLLHVATGARAGAAAGSRTRAAALGPALHLAGDLVPHEDIPSFAFEAASGAAALALLLVRRGLDAATVGAAAAAAPDLDHVLPRLRPGRRPVLHGRLGRGRARAPRLPAWLQLAAAAALLAPLLTASRTGRRRRPASGSVR